MVLNMKKQELEITMIKTRGPELIRPLFGVQIALYITTSNRTSPPFANGSCHTDRDILSQKYVPPLRSS